MACHLFGAKPSSEPMLFYCELDAWELTSVNFKSKYKISFHENAFEHVVCEIADDIFKRIFNVLTWDSVYPDTT